MQSELGKSKEEADNFSEKVVDEREGVIVKNCTEGPVLVAFGTGPRDIRKIEKYLRKTAFTVEQIQSSEMKRLYDMGILQDITVQQMNFEIEEEQNNPGEEDMDLATPTTAEEITAKQFKEAQKEAEEDAKAREKEVEKETKEAEEKIKKEQEKINKTKEKTAKKAVKKEKNKPEMIVEDVSLKDMRVSEEDLQEIRKLSKMRDSLAITATQMLIEHQKRVNEVNTLNSKITDNCKAILASHNIPEDKYEKHRIDLQLGIIENIVEKT